MSVHSGMDEDDLTPNIKEIPPPSSPPIGSTLPPTSPGAVLTNKTQAPTARIFADDNQLNSDPITSSTEGDNILQPEPKLSALWEALLNPIAGITPPRKSPTFEEQITQGLSGLLNLNQYQDRQEECALSHASMDPPRRQSLMNYAVGLPNLPFLPEGSRTRSRTPKRPLANQQ